MDEPDVRDRSQVSEYLKRQLTYAGTEHEIFSDEAVGEVYRFSSGSARLINKLCIRCIIYGAQSKRRIIDDHMVMHVIQGELS